MTTRYGFLSTYPPTLCGLATFTSALRAELVPAGESGPVVRVVEGGEQPGRQEIAADLVAGDVLSVYRAASILNDCDVAIVQHEYGVYGGPDGDEVLTLLDALTVPTVVVLHTVLSRPTAHQRTVLERVAGFADSVVTTRRTSGPSSLTTSIQVRSDPVLRSRRTTADVGCAWSSGSSMGLPLTTATSSAASTRVPGRR